MKKIFILILLIIMSGTSLSKGIFYSEKAKSSLDNLEKEINLINEGNIKKIKRSISKQIPKNILKEKLGELINIKEFDNGKSIILQRKNNKLNKGIKKINKNDLEKQLLAKFKEEYSFVLGENEELVLLKTEYEVSAVEKDEKQEILEENYHTATCTFGRKIFGLPIFNSAAKLEFSTDKTEIEFAKFTNWKEVNEYDIKGLKRSLKKESIERKINESIEKKAISESKNLNVADIKSGFIINDDNKLESSFIYLGEILDEKYQIITKFSSLENLK